LTVSNTLTCATIKWGDIYPVDHVNRLFRSVARQTNRNLRFICMTETPEGLDSRIEWVPLVPPAFEKKMLSVQKKTYHKNGALRKVALFNPAIYGLDPGAVLVLDIDIIITGQIDDLADFADGKIAMRKPFNKKPIPFAKGQGSVIKFHPALHGFLYDCMANETEVSVLRAGGSEQSYTSLTASDHRMLANFPDNWIVSYKYNCRPPKPLNAFLTPKLPTDARVICFHGRPNIDEALNGYKKNLFEMSRPASWISNYWK